MRLRIAQHGVSCNECYHQGFNLSKNTGNDPDSKVGIIYTSPTLPCKAASNLIGNITCHLILQTTLLLIA